MSAGLGLLRLDPAAFWAMTPRELDLALRAVTGRAARAPDRAALDALMRRFPDQAETK